MEKKESFETAITRILVKSGKMTVEAARALQKAFKDTAKGPFDDFILEKGLVEEADLLQAIAE